MPTTLPLPSSNALPEAARPGDARPAPSARAELAELWQARELLWAFVRNDLRVRYLGSSIGFFWTVVNPMVELLTYTFVFNFVLGVTFHPSQNRGGYVLFLFCAMVSWNAFADGAVRATTSISQHAHLIRKLNFPAIVLPAHVVASAVVNQCFRLFILMIGCILIGDGLTWHVLLVPIFVLIQATFTLGVGLLLSTLNVYFRDMSHWVNAGLMVAMFVTPVFYPASQYPREFVLLLYPNPMAQLIGIFQGLILNHHIPEALTSLLYAGLASIIALVVGASVFAHNRRTFADLV